MPPLPRTSAPELLAAVLRRQVLDGELPGGTRLREQHLSEEHDVARHTVRAALRVLEGQGLVVIEPHRGARVAELGPDDARGLHELRAILEVGAVRLALDRGAGRLPEAVHAQAERFARLCRGRPRPAWHDVVEGHAAVHAALVAACGSPRVVRAHEALQAEIELFVVRGRGTAAFDLRKLAQDHLDLVAGLEARGPVSLEEHLRDAEVG